MSIVSHTSTSRPSATAETAPRGLARLGLLVQAMRPKQWIKNGVVFLALVFSVNQYWHPLIWEEAASLLVSAFVAFLLFCLLSSSEYLINDLMDMEQDRSHPVKRNRPLPSGQLSTGYAAAAAFLLAALSLSLSFWWNRTFGVIALSYFSLIVAYSLWLKHLVILDVFTLAAGFVLRAVAGAVVIAVPISPWLYLCTVSGALFLGFTKRRHELVLLEAEASHHRSILREYTPQLLDEMIAVVTSSTLIAYSLYTFSAQNLPQNHAMMLTIPFVLYGIFRYLYLVHAKNQGGSPEEVLLSDFPLLLDIFLWIGSSVVILLIFREG